MSDGFRRRDLFTLLRRGGASGDAGDGVESSVESADAAGTDAGAGADAGAQAEAPPNPLATRDPLRPPGALFETLFVDTCHRCGLCVEVCPRQALAPLDASWGAAAGTPALVPREAPCVVCEGLECTTACPSGALMRLAVFDIQMGTAVLLQSCVALHGEECGLCVTACPVPGALLGTAGHPQVDDVRCIGCGVCEHVCPTDAPSIVVEPARTIDAG